MFAVKDAEEAGELPAGDTNPGASAPGSPGPLPSRTALLLSCGLAAVVLAAGLYFYWPFGGSPPPSQPDTLPPGTTPPAALAGLRHLPAGANVVFAVQPGPVLAYAERTGADPKAVLATLMIPREAVDGLERAGLPLDRIDHVVGGVTLTPADLFPGFALVLKLRQPVADEERFLQALKAEKKPKAGRPVYAVFLAGLPLTMTTIDDRTYLFGFLEKDLSAADAPPGPAALPPALRDAITTKLSPASFAWAATDAAAWADMAVVKAFATNSKDPRVRDRFELLGRGRQAVVGASLEPDPRLRVAVRTRDAEAAGGLREYLAGKLPAAAVGGEGEWAEADVPFDPAAGGDVLRRLLGEK
jgi:hypothetical protein